MIDGRTTISRKSGVVLTRTGGEGVLVDEDGGSVHVVNDTAVRVWELCESAPTFEQLCRVMGQEYEADQLALAGDLEELLRTFSGLELVELTAAA